MRRSYCLLFTYDILAFRALGFEEFLQHAFVVAWLVSNKHLGEPIALSCSSDSKITAKCVNVLWNLLASDHFHKNGTAAYREEIEDGIGVFPALC